MKMIESARIIVKQKGICYNYYHCETISCDDCFNGQNRKKCVDFTDEKTLALAEAYIKRHEGKSKKKDHIRDAKKKVEEPTVKENLSVPQPIKFDDPVPEYVYLLPVRVKVKCCNRFKHILDNKEKVVDEIMEMDNHRINMSDCYHTPEEALAVAKKLWGKE